MRCLAIVLLLSGCSGVGRFIGTERFRHGTYRVYVGDEGAVSRHCTKIVKNDDSGKPLSFAPPCCYVYPRAAGKMGTMWIGRRYYKWCREHEGAHQEGMTNEEAGKLYPRNP